MGFSAVLFDVGYTLLDYGPQTRYPEFRMQRMKELYPLAIELWGDVGLSPEEFGTVLGAGVQTERTRAIEHSGFSLSFLERLGQALLAAGIRADHDDLQCFTVAFVEPMRTWSKPYPETRACLERLQAFGMKMAIITNAPWDIGSELLYADLERWGLRSFFSAFISSGEVPWRKPNPEFMWEAAKRLTAPPQQCLVVGDNLTADIGGAGSAGMKSVWVNRDGAAAPPEGPPPNWTVTSLSEIVEIVREG